MLLNFLRIATRKSPLALYQANYIKKILIKAYPSLIIEIVPIITSGDLILDKTLNDSGGKGLFIKELELAIMEKKVDIAVHSMKDVPIILPESLDIVTMCKRNNPLDAFISNHYGSINALPKHAVIGTSSMRRKFQLHRIRPDIKIKNLRGNIGTRLAKLDSEKYDAIILATAGLQRLGLNYRIKQIIPAEQILPAVGQGAIGIECLIKNKKIIQLLSILTDIDTVHAINAERSMSFYLNANCNLPIGGYAILKKKKIWVRGIIGSIDGKKIIKAETTGNKKFASQIGMKLAKKLIKKGAKDIIHN